MSGKVSIRVTVARSHAEASDILTKLMRAASPDDPDLLESWTIEVFPAHDALTGLDRGGKALVAWPRGEHPSPSNLVAVVYGDEEVTAEAERRGFFNED